MARLYGHSEDTVTRVSFSLSLPLSVEASIKTDFHFIRVCLGGSHSTFIYCVRKNQICIFYLLPEKYSIPIEASPFLA